MYKEEKNKVEPVAWYGPENGFIQALSVFMKEDNEISNDDPVSMAIHTGRLVVNNNIEADDPFRIRWREEALKRSFYSCACVPISYLNKMIGVFMLFTEIPNFFNDEELRLLSGVAEDISFALEVIENEAVRRNLENELKNYRSQLENTIQIRTAELAAAHDELLVQYQEKELQNKELIRAKEKAETSDRLKTIFLSTMSHEIRTPLNSIIGFSGILKQEITGPLNDEQKKQLELIQKGGQHLLSIINVILDLARIESGELKPSYEHFDINELILEVTEMVRPQAEIKNLPLTITTHNENGLIKSDRQRVFQVILNVVNNAVKFTSEGEININSQIEKDSYVIKVSDTGIGIEHEDLDKIFNPFTQVDNLLTKKYEGSGLGLSITKKIMEMLHGKIEVNSEPNIGSTFIITLPLDPDS